MIDLAYYGGAMQSPYIMTGGSGDPSVLEQTTGVVTRFVTRSAVISDRNDKRRKIGEMRPLIDVLRVFEIKTPGQLNIQKGDMLFEAKRDLPSEVVYQSPDDNVFSSWCGEYKFKTAHEYRLRWRFLMISQESLAFDNESQPRGVTGGIHGVFNFQNLSPATMHPGDLLTWEPDDVELDGTASRRSKRFRAAGPEIIKGRFVKWVQPDLDDVIKEPLSKFYPSLDAVVAPSTPLDYALRYKLFSGADDVIAVCEEEVAPGNYGRVSL